MSVITHRTLTCDRCGASTEAKEESQEYDWGMIEGGSVVGDVKVGTDLCPACLRSLVAWFSNACR